MSFAIVIIKLEAGQVVERPVSLLSTSSFAEAEIALTEAASRLGFPHRMDDPEEHVAFYINEQGDALYLDSVDTEQCAPGPLRAN